MSPPRRAVAEPFFSVVIPTYRRPALLREAIDSVLAQTCGDFELIVVDDDPALSAREALAGIVDHRVRYVENDHRRGGAGTRNAGIERATGKWVAFLDDDDVWLPEKLARQLEKIEAGDEELGIVYTGSAVFDFDKREIVSRRRWVKEGWISRDLLLRNWVGGFFSVVIRRDLLVAVGGLDERFPALQDVDLFVRVARRAKVAFVDETLVLVRKDHDDRITSDPRKKLEASQLFLRKYRVEIRGDPRLRHRAAARIFTYAAASGDLGALFRSLPWTMTGLIVDPGNIREVSSRLLRFYKQNRGRKRRSAARAGPR